MLIVKGIFALSTCVLVLAISSSSVYPEPHSKAENKPATQDQRGTKEHPFVIQGDIANKTPKESEEDRYTEYVKIEIERSLAKYTAVSAYATAVLVAVTGILALFTFLLWSATHSLVLGADKTSKKELRAYVGVASVKIIDGADAKSPFRGIFLIQNFGKTIAMKTTIRINGIMSDKEPTDFSLEDKDIKSTTVVMPNELLGGIEQDLPRAIEKVTDDSLYLWGRIDYTDVFGKDHWTKFCFRSYKREHFPQSTGGTTPGFAVKTIGEDSNDADND